MVTFPRRALRPVVAAVVVVAGGWSCGRGGGNSLAPTITPSPVAQVGSPLPYGQATRSGASCPSGSPAGSTCKRVLVTCPSVSPAAAILRITRSASTTRVPLS